MIYNFMRLLVFFDLPVETKANRHAYSIFRKYLIKQGYMMIQYSIYSKIFNNQDSLENHLKLLSRNLPKEGSIRALMITEKQYSKIKILLGVKTQSENIITDDPIIKL